jgi:hypothetical protein
MGFILAPLRGSAKRGLRFKPSGPTGATADIQGPTKDPEARRLSRFSLCFCVSVVKYLVFDIAAQTRNARDSVKSWAFVEQPLPRKAVLADSFGRSVTLVAVPELVSPAGLNHCQLTHLSLHSQFGCQRSHFVSCCGDETFIPLWRGGSRGCAKICISLPPLYRVLPYFVGA